MGNKNSTKKPKANSLVDVLLNKKKKKKITKVLILGAGESGKTTLIKQLRLIHKNSFNDQETQVFKAGIYQNIVSNMKTLIDTAIELEIQFQNSQNIEALKNVLDKNEMSQASTYFNKDLSNMIYTAWKDMGIQTVANTHYASLHLPDSADYFFNELPRIGEPNYVPNDNDLVRVRIRTTGINELKVVNPDGGNLVIVDVGGQQNERKYWIQAFNEVNAVIFVVGSSDYDKLMWEDDETNRLEDSLRLFNEIANHKAFEQTAMILFLNKWDVFKEKASRVNINVCFQDYQDGLVPEKAIKFMENKFRAVNKKHKNIFVHYTSATDSQLTAQVFEDIKTTVLNKSLAANGLIRELSSVKRVLGNSCLIDPQKKCTN